MTPPSTLRRLGIALAGLAVAALTGAACALSFDDLRGLAVTGEARQDLAFLYPAAFDALLVVAMIGVLLLRSARLLVRVQTAIVLILLIVAAAAANVATAVRFTFDARQAAVGVALAPWIMLAVALWLWLLMIKNVQERRVSGEYESDDGEPDLVPFHRARPAETPPPLVTEAPAPVMEPTPLVGPTAAPETPPVPDQERPPLSAQVTEWPAQEQLDEPVQAQQQARAHVQARQQVHEPVEDQQKAHEPVPVQEQAHEPVQDQEQAHEPVQDQEHAWAAAEPAQEADEELREEPETRPVRWGDRVKPADVLVHPRPDDGDADTQPHPVFEDEEVPDPEHGPEAADAGERQAVSRADSGPRTDSDTDAGERREDGLADTAPHPVVHEDTPAPSGRLRSSPRPPED
ncbi:DUF2637 domain-containing protein [Nonomuraea turkmeniaca]|uniref:DUF2637 domain-containing protein n=1 Tax=Nonomuraea turkmeniaca TaxID=103838 RepID=A0A5S4FRK2_9ACTN|nr:DUF2637 domain-containing protein [Nonomuraea turkmeniaca]TMR23253.1 DUF2637 domain-containing protein [Nonomuraea turkmeniaca]